MSILTVLTVVRWYQRMMGMPSGPTRNFSKFQRMSWTFMGSQKRRSGEPRSSEVGGQEFWRGNVYGVNPVGAPPLLLPSWR